MLTVETESIAGVHPQKVTLPPDTAYHLDAVARPAVTNVAMTTVMAALEDVTTRADFARIMTMRNEMVTRDRGYRTMT